MLDAKETVWNFQDYISGHAHACESTSTNFQDDLTASLENPKNRIFPKILR